ncbi:MAG: DUF2752 domain-containing protein [Oscillospiraceae bacterium]|nr:DUF2752 domain-containing protein [Oscillospiraceae bacterium]
MKLTKTRKIILITYGALFIAGLLFYLLIKILGHGIPCAYYQKTGLLCAGCGATRMFLSMLRLDFAAAFSYNQGFFCIFWLWNLISVLCFTEKLPFMKKSWFWGVAVIGSAVLLSVFTIIRNFV